MPDIRLVQNTLFPKYSVTLDWMLLGDGRLDEDQALATAVCVALGTDRLASKEDILPDPDSSDRAGWWGDLDAYEIWRGWPIGCRLWLMKRAKITDIGAMEGSTVVRVEQYIIEAIQPFIDLKIASRAEVKATRADKQRIDALVRLFRGPELAVDLRYQVLWEDIVSTGDDYNIGKPINPL
jgi:phage gp46-like protein